MNFIYANELKTKFSCYGHYYQLLIGGASFPCRSTLDIVSVELLDASNSTPNAVVIMMNPGSSRPFEDDVQPITQTCDELFNNSRDKEFVRSQPDNAQYQMMRLMLLNDWQHIRIINLSDLRNGNSGQFALQYKKAEALDDSNPHSLTHPLRKPELLNLCPDNSLIIAAWGSIKVLINAATTLLELKPDVIGLALKKPWYRFASPYRKDHKMNWLAKMDDIIKSHQQ